MDVVKKEGQGTQSEEVRPESPAESEPSSDRELVDFLMSPAGYGLMGQRQQARDAVDLIKTAVDASPTGMTLIRVRAACSAVQAIQGRWKTPAGAGIVL